MDSEFMDTVLIRFPIEKFGCPVCFKILKELKVIFYQSSICGNCVEKKCSGPHSKCPVCGSDPKEPRSSFATDLEVKVGPRFSLKSEAHFDVLHQGRN